jgi:biotin synthase-like enzyme
LFSYADDLTTKVFGDKVYHRGIVEFSNVCENDCGYCGVRKHAPPSLVAAAADADGKNGGGATTTTTVPLLRYTMPEEEVAEVARWAHTHGIGTLMLQGGELDNEARLNYLERVVSRARRETVAADIRDGKAAAVLGVEALPPLSASFDQMTPAEQDAELNRLIPTEEQRQSLGLRIALSVGELDEKKYRRLFAAGARRYLLRIETSSPDLYAVLHPPDMHWDRRVECLHAARRAGFQVGTGVMVGLPAQRLDDLAGDVLFFRDLGANMIGMGPYITESGTPVADLWEQVYGVEGVAYQFGAEEAARRARGVGSEGELWCGREADARRAAEREARRHGGKASAAPPPPSSSSSDQKLLKLKEDHKKRHMRAMFELTTRVNALARLAIPGANITATTALQAIDPNGREVALRRGANVLMPILTPTQYRQHYQLYEGKPCVTDTADECRRCLTARVGMIGRRLKLGEYGDPPNFLEQQQRLQRVKQSQQQVAGISSTSLGRRSFSSAAAAAEPARAPCASTTPTPPPGPTAGSDVQRVNVGVFGSMNAGKSTLTNAITRQDTSIVDSTPGTTADVRTTLLELHGLGPAKLFDTAGLDEQGELGEKKRRKALGALKECDVAVVVVDVAKHREAALSSTAVGGGGGAAAAAKQALRGALQWERLALERALQAGAVPLLLLNLRGAGKAASPSSPDLTHPLFRAAAAVREAVSSEVEGGDDRVLALALDLHGTTGATGARVARDVADAVSAAVKEAAARSAARPGIKALPEWCLAESVSHSPSPSPSSSDNPLLQPASKPGYVFMVIPMDAETPSARLLRPQALVQEESIRHWATTTAFRLDVGAARGAKGKEAQRAERLRFLRALKPALEHDGPKLLVTDSQAIDVVHPWTLESGEGEEEEALVSGGGGRQGVPAAALGEEKPSSTSPHHARPLLPITTFSIAMINRVSGGRLPLFVEGLRAFAALKPGDRVLVAEACNHSRITAACADIGLVQIPQRLRERAGGEVDVEHAFGREFPELVGGEGGGGGGGESGGSNSNRSRFALAAHCGGCMIDAQKMRARLSDAEEAGLPVTNYGLLLAYSAAPEALERCLAPWGVGGWSGVVGVVEGGERR